MAHCCPSLLHGVIWMTSTFASSKKFHYLCWRLHHILFKINRDFNEPQTGPEIVTSFQVSQYDICLLATTICRQGYSNIKLSVECQLASQCTLQSLTKPSVVSTHSPCCRCHLHSVIHQSEKQREVLPCRGCERRMGSAAGSINTPGHDRSTQRMSGVLCFYCLEYPWALSHPRCTFAVLLFDS